MIDSYDAAGVLVDDPDRGVLLMWRHRFLSDEWGWEIPGGMVDPGETPEQAARRECIEESGWAPGPMRPVCRFRPIAGLSSQTFWIFSAAGAEQVGEPDPDEAERVEWVPREEFRRLVGGQRVVGRPDAWWRRCTTWPSPDPPPGGPRRPGEAASALGVVPVGEVGQAGVVGEHLDQRDVEAEALLQALDLELLVLEHQRDHHARLAGAGGAAGAVQVGLVVGRRVVVDDHVDVVDVDAAGRDVGGDQGVELARRRSRAAPARASFWRRSPWMAAAFTPSSSSLPARRSAPCLVAVKTIVRSVLRMIAAATFTLSISWTGRNRCVICSTVTPLDATSWRVGSVW